MTNVKDRVAWLIAGAALAVTGAVLMQGRAATAAQADTALSGIAVACEPHQRALVAPDESAQTIVRCETVDALASAMPEPARAERADVAPAAATHPYPTEAPARVTAPYSVEAPAPVAAPSPAAAPVPSAQPAPVEVAASTPPAAASPPRVDERPWWQEHAVVIGATGAGAGVGAVAGGKKGAAIGAAAGAGGAILYKVLKKRNQ